jgi:hypothetical protein
MLSARVALGLGSGSRGGARMRVAFLLARRMVRWAWSSVRRVVARGVSVLLGVLRRRMYTAASLIGCVEAGGRSWMVIRLVVVFSGVVLLLVLELVLVLEVSWIERFSWTVKCSRGYISARARAVLVESAPTWMIDH